MAPDGSPGVDAETDVGATVPWLARLAVVSLLVGVVLLAVGAVLVTAATTAATRR